MSSFRLLEKDIDDAEAAPAAAFVTIEAIETREIFNEGRYRAIVENLDFMWRWKIFRDDVMCQEGCSLSEASSREAVRHVLAFYDVRDTRQTAGS